MVGFGYALAFQKIPNMKEITSFSPNTAVKKTQAQEHRPRGNFHTMHLRSTQWITWWQVTHSIGRFVISGKYAPKQLWVLMKPYSPLRIALSPFTLAGLKNGYRFHLKDCHFLSTLLISDGNCLLLIVLICVACANIRSGAAVVSGKKVELSGW